MKSDEIKKQPEWCTYPDAGVPGWGCYSLWFGKVTGEDYCKECDAYIENVKKIKKQMEQNSKAKEFLEKYSDEKLGEMALRQYPNNPVAVGYGEHEDINGDARFYAIRGMQLLRDEIYDEMRKSK